MFISLDFAAFVCITLILHNVTRGRLQNVVLLVASYIIYAYWDWRFLALLWLATAVTFFVSRRLASRRYLYAGVLFNLAVLGIFKYANFFIDSGVSTLNRIGVAASVQPLAILLPLGISFYTFRLLSYLFDVRSRRIDAAAVSWIDFALYVAFFPQIVSGPIERAPGFLASLKGTRRLDQQRFVLGLTAIFIGLYYKIAIADPLVATVDAAFSKGAAPADALAGMILFSVQLYADFAGYSAIAIGLSQWFGLPAMENFRQPYFAASVVEFWTRWHISLSTWFRDYLFYPLSRSLLRRWGSKRAATVQVVSYLVTMLATGLWHGANWTFVIWGLLHGVYMSGESLLARLRHPDSDSPWRSRLTLLLKIIITQVAIAVAWVFFRAASVNDALQFLQRITLINQVPDLSWWVKISVPILMILVIDVAQAWTKDNRVLWRVNPVWRTALIGYILLCLFIFGGKPSVPFVYLRF